MDERAKLKVLDWSKIRVSVDVSTCDRDAGVRAFSNDEPHDYIDDGDGHVMVCVTGEINEPQLITHPQPDEAIECVRALREALEAHHNWHCNRGKETFATHYDQWLTMDMAAEYGDSSMFEKTTAALTRANRFLEGKE